MTEKVAPTEVEVTADNPEDIDEVYSELRGVPGITVTAMPAPAGPGEQGAGLDALMVAMSSGAVTAFLQIIKVLAESRRPKFSLKVRQGKNRLEVTADNIDDVLPVIREMLDGS
jgi:hypothetical protein